jgi:hypothetical protein
MGVSRKYITVKITKILKFSLFLTTFAKTLHAYYAFNPKWRKGVKNATIEYDRIAVQ